MHAEQAGAAAPSGLDTPEFLARLKALEPEAIETVYRIHGPTLLRYAYRLTGDWSHAQDIVSEVFVRLLDRIDRYQPRNTPLLAWLYRVARNLAIDQQRRRQRRPMVALEAISGQGAAEAGFSAEAHDLAQALAGLSEEHREVLQLRFQEQLSAEEVAAILGRSVPAVRSLQHRALQALRSHLEARDG